MADLFDTTVQLDRAALVASGDHVDFDLVDTGDGYDLAFPVAEDEQRMRNRWRVQFLSCFKEVTFRGCTFVTELGQSAVKTNADVIGLFALSSGQIIPKMRTFAVDIFPIRSTLDDFDFLDEKRILLNFTVTSAEGEIQEALVVEGTTT